jgi:GGDEF domain-containing protein
LNISVRRLEEKIKRDNRQKNHEFDLTLSVGISPVDLQSQISIEELVRQADERMYKQKRVKKIVAPGTK